MTTEDLIKIIYLRLTKFRWLVLFFAVLMCALFFLYAKSVPVLYSVRATVFPLTNTETPASKLPDIFTGGTSKNLSDEATINIEEVAKSRRTREAIVSQRLNNMQNKLIAEIIIDDYNATKSFFTKTVKMPKSDSDKVITGAALFSNFYTTKFNKNNLLEVTITSGNKDLMTPVSYALIDRLSYFYKELKRKKAAEDFDFTERKVDSLEAVMNRFDRAQVRLNQTTLFVPKDRIQYSIPKENLRADKERVMAQRNGAAANREEALWRLQKVTPIIEILDKPDPPFTPLRPSKLIYMAAGFFVGLILILVAFIFGPVYTYLNSSVKRLVFPLPERSNTTSTAGV